MKVLMLETILNAPVDDAAWHFNWGIHIVTIPMTVAIGVFIGWMMREKKAVNDEARRALEAEQESKS